MIAEQLRKSILQAAIQGKLTEQLQEDGDAKVLLKEIQKEKISLIKQGTIKKEKPFPEISEEEIPFDIPSNWCWARIGEVFTLQAGKFTTADSIKNGGKYPCYGGNGIRGFVDIYNRSGRFPLIGRQGALCGNINIAEGDFYATEHAVIVQTYCNCEVDWAAYLLTALDLNQYSTATAQPGLSVNKINQVVIPIPPIDEQNRIAKLLADLLPEVNTLKNDEIKLDILQKSFPKKMKDSILQNAIQGKLTEQLPEDGDAQDLLKEIRKEKSSLMKKGEINKEKLLLEMKEDEIPFDIPDNWAWCYLQDVSVKVHYGYTASASTSGNSKLLRITDIQDNTVNWDQIPFCDISESQLKTYILHNRDIVIARTGGTIGKTYIVSKLSCVAVFASYLIRIIPSESVNEKYIKYFMESDLYWKQLNGKSQGTGQPNVNGESLKSLVLPLPPIAEQKRIVGRLEELMPLCESLE